ncbi:MAG: glycoside hydrolase family 9 protein [Pirellulales bacterium]
MYTDSCYSFFVSAMAVLFVALVGVGAVGQCADGAGDARITLHADGYFTGPGLRFLVYHNTYVGGRQGGLQMLLHGTRVLDAGTLFVRTRAGKQYGYYGNSEKQIGSRRVDVDGRVASLPGKFVALGMKYELAVTTDGESIAIRVQLDKPVDWSTVSDCVLKIEIFPEAYFNTTYHGGGLSDSFQERHMGRRLLIPSAEKIVVAPEVPHRTLTFCAHNARLSLRDERRDLRVSGYMVWASLPPGSEQKTFSLTITPKLDTTWRRDPVIQVSQLGFHPDQRKRAVLEIDSRVTEVGEISLSRIDESGTGEVIKRGMPVRWGPLFDYQYYLFDFSDVVEPGLYFLKYGRQRVGPLTIGRAIYQTAWHPTMDTFFPVQMCHVKVRDYLIVWHGACHVDDALQAPPNQVVIDGYRQGPETETRFQANEHVPNLDWGGWHDAGDFDLPVGAVAGTALWMALAQEEFAPDRDVVSILRGKRLVELYEGDGKQDMPQQVAYGMEFLLGMVRSLGHLGAGIIANNGPDYGRAGDPATITDGRIDAPQLERPKKNPDHGDRPDDRWVFTNRNTGGQYQFVQVAAAASRCLRGHDDALADDSLEGAKAVWEFEQTHDPVQFQVAYQPQEDAFHSWELAATAELFLTTGDAIYRDRLLALLPSIEQMPAARFGRGVGYTLLRASERLDSEPFRRAIGRKAQEFSQVLRGELAKSPYGVQMDFGIWGNNWSVLQQTARLYFFVKQFPRLFDAESVYSGLHYNFGCHPATNHSYVSGVGTKSATVAFGFNRNDSTYIPGGVVSGASLIRPKFPEYRARPWDWYQTEYVIQGSAAYVFSTLAADALLNADADSE